jgi:hypothetical protein
MTACVSGISRGAVRFCPHMGVADVDELKREDEQKYD